MTSELTEEQQKLLNKIAEDANIFEYDIEAKAGSMKGDNYMGVITSVTIKNRTDSREIHLVLKSAHESKMFRDQAPVRKAYLREIEVYDKVFPELNNFAREFGVEAAFTGHAKCYGFSSLEPHEFLVLGNLRELGYDLWSRTQPMNPEHLSIVFTEYGKFHALSLAMKHKQPGRFAELTSNLDDIFETKLSKEVYKTMFKSQIDKTLKSLEGHQEAYEAMQKYISNEERISEMMAASKEVNEFSVILHGDCWNNNMMFKYDCASEHKNPSKVCLLDWQITKVGSPVMDLSYFFYVCSPKESLDNFRVFWKIYHDSLCEMLTSLGCDPQTIFPYSQLEIEWKRHSLFGLHAAMFLIKIMLTERDEVPDMVELVESGKNLFESLDVQSIHEEEYNRRLADVVVFMSRNEFL